MSCSPDASFGNQRACCSGVPASSSGSEPELLDGEDQPGRGAGAAELLDRQADAQQLAAEAAVLDRERQREDVLGGEQLREVLRELAGPVDLGGARRDPLVGEDADRVAEDRAAPRSGGTLATRSARMTRSPGHRSRVWHSVRACTGARPTRWLAGPPLRATLSVTNPARGAGTSHAEERHVDPTTGLLLVIIAASSASSARSGSCVKQRRAEEALGRESPFAVATEGMKRCPSCGTGNLVTDATCSNCGKPLPG